MIFWRLGLPGMRDTCIFMSHGDQMCIKYFNEQLRIICRVAECKYRVIGSCYFQFLNNYVNAKANGIFDTEENL